MSTAEIPSTSAWWLLAISANPPDPKPVHQPHLPQRLRAVQRLGEQPPGQHLQLVLVAGRGQAGVAQVVAQVEVRVVDPHGAALLERHLGEALAKARHEVQARLDVHAQLVPRRGRPVEDRHRRDVQRRARLLAREERGVQRGDPVALGHRGRFYGCAIRRPPRDQSSFAAMPPIAHLDVDAFYASVELQRRPELRGLPVIVSGSGPRAVVTTASYEARKFGIGSAMPTSRARRLCPDAILVPPDFAAYREASSKVMARVRAQVERVEVVGPRRGVPRPRRADVAARGDAAAGRGDPRRDRAGLLDRHRAQPARREGRVGCREAARLRRADPRGGVRALRLAPAGAGSGDRAEDRRAAAAARADDARGAGGGAAGAARRASSAPTTGPTCSASRASRARRR